MNILFIGDIMGKPGRSIVKKLLPEIKKEFKIDFVIANGENLAGGFGLTPEVAKEAYDAGVNVLTTGNHIWDKKDVMKIINDDTQLLRPANYPSGVPGRGSGVFRVQGSNDLKIGVVNLNGRVFMPALDCPFRKGKSEIEALKKETSIIIVDFHAEATSEKMAFAWYVDGLASAVIGTHTHVQTADERILSAGTGYISDAGMTGSADSVIGMDKDIAINRFLDMIPAHFAPATENLIFHGLFVSVNADGRADAIQRVVKRLD